MTIIVTDRYEYIIIKDDHQGLVPAVSTLFPCVFGGGCGGWAVGGGVGVLTVKSPSPHKRIELH